jgi:hypothetical protein
MRLRSFWSMSHWALRWQEGILRTAGRVEVGANRCRVSHAACIREETRFALRFESRTSGGAIVDSGNRIGKLRLNLGIQIPTSERKFLTVIMKQDRSLADEGPCAELKAHGGIVVANYRGNLAVGNMVSSLPGKREDLHHDIGHAPIPLKDPALPRSPRPRMRDAA